jgi:hypothetical protein
MFEHASQSGGARSTIQLVEGHADLLPPDDATENVRAVGLKAQG